MTIPRPRLTVRRLMTAVALAGLASGAVAYRERLSRRRALYLVEMMHSKNQARLTRDRIEVAEGDLDTLADLRERFRVELREARSQGEKGSATARVREGWIASLAPEEAEGRRTLAGLEVRLAYWEERRDRYRLAAHTPWFEIDPGPPEPPDLPPPE